MEPQTLLIIVVVALSALLAIVGIQVFLILMDMRKAIKRLNSLIDNAPTKVTELLEMLRKNKDSQQ